jgi:uncharacterized damage-inducible protein DinB
MEAREVYLELYGRLPGLVRHAVEGLTPEQLTERPTTEANPVGWLVWHLTRVQDHHVAEVLEQPQLWESGDWARRFGGADPDPQNHGYGHTAAEVAGVRPESTDALLDYFDAVSARTEAFVRGLTGDDLERIVDRRWDPPVTLGVRLASVVDDSLQHAGQAAYVRGLLGS